MKNKIAKKIETVHRRGDFKEKYIIKLTVFVLLFIILLHFCIIILWLNPTPISYFYDEPKNSLDVIYIGSSNAYAHFNTVLAYDLYGFTTGVMSADSQPFSLVKYCIEEAKKYQEPSLYVIDIARAAQETSSFTQEEMRKTTDSMKFSKNRIDAINECLSYKNNINRKDYINHYFSFLLYHNRWKEPKNLKSNIFGNKTLYKGYYFADYTSQIEPQETYSWSQDIIELEEKGKELLINLLEYIKTNNINVLFVVPERNYDKDTNGKLNDVIKIIQENDLKVINFNTLEDFNKIDFSKDYYNKVHLNVYGATKYTLYFAKYLHENYKLENHKNDKNYDSWNKEYERFKKNFNIINNMDFNDLL